MPGKRSSKKAQPAKPAASPRRAARPSALLDTRIIYCGDCLDQLAKLPDGCVDRPYLWHRFPTGESDSNRNYEVFWGETKEKRAFEDRHASHYVEVMLDQVGSTWLQDSPSSRILGNEGDSGGYT